MSSLLSGQSEFMSVWFLICELVQVLLWNLVVNFSFLSSDFLVLPLDLICSQVHILTSYCSLVPSD